MIDLGSCEDETGRRLRGPLFSARGPPKRSQTTAISSSCNLIGSETPYRGLFSQGALYAMGPRARMTCLSGESALRPGAFCNDMNKCYNYQAFPAWPLIPHVDVVSYMRTSALVLSTHLYIHYGPRMNDSLVGKDTPHPNPLKRGI